MLDKINGLPGHVLLVHAVIVLTPLACLCLVASAAWPAARARLGVVTPVLALIALILVPITTSAGEWLRDHLGNTPAIKKHADLGDSLLPWAIGVFVLSAAVWVASRYYDLAWRPAASAPDPAVSRGDTAVAVRTRTVLPVWVTAVVVLVCGAVAIGTMITLYRIGDSGAHAVWNGVVK